MDIYAENILEHYKNPQNKGVIENADIVQTGANPLCGDHLVLYFKLNEDKISDIKFEGKGCAISQAAISMLTEELKGMTLESAARISKSDILKMLGVEIGPTRMKCALLGLNTVKAAVKGNK